MTNTPELATLHVKRYCGRYFHDFTSQTHVQTDAEGEQACDRSALNATKSQRIRKGSQDRDLPWA